MAAPPASGSETGTRSCPVCSANRVREVLRWPDIPVNNTLFFETAAEARSYPRATLALVGCEACGFLFNGAFDAELTRYDATYIETQSGSQRHGRFAEALARDWIERYALRGRTALEVGCGRQPDFLRRFCSISGGRGIGIDPAVDIACAGADLELLAERFDDRTLDRRASALICRHTLEHIPDVGVFLSLVRRWSEGNADAVILFEVPDTTRILAERAFWDVYYEHCSYFTPASLTAAFELAGFAVERCERVFEGQYLILDARPTSAPPRLPRDEGVGVVASAQEFAVDVDARVDAARAALRRLARDGTVVIWQASSKAVSLLTLLGGSVDVAALADVNPAKRGKFIVGSGHRVVAPEDVPSLAPSDVVVMNSVYLGEIRAQLGELGVDARVHAVEDLIEPRETGYALGHDGTR